MSWKITKVGKIPKLKNPVFIEGLPGIGNVGKIAVDFIVEELKAKKIYDLFSYTLPHSVFVNEDNLVELPKIEIYCKKTKKQDLLFLIGDLQPLDEVSNYEFCESILDILEELGCKEIITVAGIGLQNIPKKPKVYCTGNDKDMIKRYKKGTKLKDELYGVVGPIVGVSGILLGLSKKRNIPAIGFLAETLGHPMYLGIKGSKEIVNILNKKLDLKIDVNKLEKEIKDLEKEMLKRTEDLINVTKKNPMGLKGKKDSSYIG